MKQMLILSNRPVAMLAIGWLIVAMVLPAPSTTLAAPSITDVSGTFNKGETVTLSGSGFMPKATAGPMVWDSFESGVNGRDIRSHAPDRTTLSGGTWVWETVGTPDGIVYSTDNQRVGSTRSAVAIMEDNVWNKSLQVIAAQSEYYVRWWVYYDNTGSTISRNTKPWIMYGSGTGDGCDDEPVAYAGWGDENDSSLRDSIHDTCAGYIGPTKWAGPKVTTIFGKWLLFEVYLKQSGADDTDGAYKVWVTEPGESPVLQLSFDNIATRASDLHWRQFTWLGAYSDAHNSAGTVQRRYRIYGDDFYFDNTQSRVVLCSGAFWSDRGVCELQPATGWLPNSIEVVLNTGAFSSGSQCYLYVVDSTGAANGDGRSIIIGDSDAPDLLPPAAPLGLAVE